MTKYITFILISAIGFLPVLSCGSSKVTSKTTPRQSAKSDTLPLPPQKNELPPGTAKINAEFIDTARTNGGYLLSMKVLSVLGYGHSTPPLAPGRELEVTVPDLLADSVSTILSASQQDSVVTTISFAPVPDLGEEKPPEWNLITVRRFKR